MSCRHVLLAGAALWVAAAALAAEPAELPDCQPEPGQALAALNALRMAARHCGGTVAPAAVAPAAVAPLSWDERLADSARRYAGELARRDTLSHQGQVSRGLRDRLRAAGYPPTRSAGENLAAGPDSLDEVLAQWLASPSHCENLMAPDFREVGLACVAASGRYERFWVLHLARRAGDAARP